MARFARGDEVVELIRDGTAIVERTAFGDARRTLHDERAALIAYYARITELLDARWSRTSAFVDDLRASSVAAEEPPLVAAIDAGDLDALDVYTDWLLERGDPRGELAALRRAPDPDARQISSLEKRRGLELYGPLSTLPRRWRQHFTYVWRRGWIAEVVFAYVPEEDLAQHTPPDREVMQHALHAPMARFVHWLSVDTWYMTPIWECLGACTCLPRVRGVRLAGAFPCYREMLDQLPALEELELLATPQTTGGHPGVWRVRLPLTDEPARLAGTWPALRRLELVVQDPLGIYRGGLELVELPTLRELVIEAPSLGDAVVEDIVARTANVDVLDIRAELSETARRLLSRRPS